MAHYATLTLMIDPVRYIPPTATPPVAAAVSSTWSDRAPTVACVTVPASPLIDAVHHDIKIALQGFETSLDRLRLIFGDWDGDGFDWSHAYIDGRTAMTPLAWTATVPAAVVTRNS